MAHEKQLKKSHSSDNIDQHHPFLAIDSIVDLLAIVKNKKAADLILNFDKTLTILSININY